MMKLSEYTKDEWRSVAKRLKPGLTDVDYDKMWDDFISYKNKRKLN